MYVYSERKPRHYKLGYVPCGPCTTLYIGDEGEVGEVTDLSLIHI